MFAVNRGNIKKRFDPHANHPKFQTIFSRLEKYTILPLRDYTECIFSGITPKAGGEAYTETDDGILFIKSGSLSNDGILTIDTTSKIKPDIHNGLMKSSKLKRNDVLIAIVGATIGKIGLFDLTCEANINQAIAAVRLKDSILPEFLVAYMLSPFGQAYLEYLKRPVARANINLQEIGEIGVPLLSIEQQQAFINAFYTARNQKVNRLKQATEEYQQALKKFERETALFDFSSFDNKLFFSAYLKDIKGKRFDVKNVYYCQSIATKEIINSTLGSLSIDEPCYGVSATAIERTREEQPKYIRITDFDDFGIAENHEYMAAETYAEKHLLKKNDILFARTGGTVGKTYFYDGSIGNAVFAGYCIRFRFNESKVIPKYVYWCTKTSSYQNWVKGIQRPSGQPNINKEEYKSFEIALPCLEEQRKLVEFMDEAFLSCRQTIKQAEIEWQAAKEQFEKELLGE